MNILYLNLIQLGFILLFFNGKKHVAGQFFVNETQGIGFSLYRIKILVNSRQVRLILANFGVDGCDYKSGKIISTNERSENPSFIAFRLRRACED